MAYTIRESLVNKNKISNMSLLDIKKKYGWGDLLKEELERRKLLSLKEVRDFCEHYYPFKIDINNGHDDIDYLSNFLNLSPIEILKWDKILKIYDGDANKYLSKSDEWLKDERILKKINQDFIYQTLLKNENYYHYSNLLENLKDSQIISIIMLENVNYNKIPNIKKLLKKVSLKDNEKRKVLKKIIDTNNTELLLFYLNELMTERYQKVEALYLLKNLVPNQKILDILTILPNDLLELMEKFSLLDLDKKIDLLIINNSLYQKTNGLYDNEILSKITNSPEHYFAKVETLNTLNYFLLNNIDYKLPYEIQTQIQNLQNQFIKYLLNHEELLKKYIDNSLIKDKILSFLKNSKITPLEEKIIVKYLKKLDLSKDDFLTIVKKYPTLKSELLNSPDLKEIINNIKYGKFKILSLFPEFMDKLIENKEFLEIIKDIKPSKLMFYLDINPLIEQKIFTNSNLLNEMIKTKEDILSFLPLLNKYKINNPIINRFNESLKKIRTKYPELSYGNSSLRVEMLDEEFINNINMDYLIGVLEYSSKAADIIVSLYKNGKLNEVNKWLDFVTKNINENNRMIHHYICSYEMMENLTSEIISSNIKLTDYQKQLLEEIALNQNKYNIKTINDLNNYFKIKSEQICKKENLTEQDINELFLNSDSHKKAMLGGQTLSINIMTDLDFEYFEYKYVSKGIISKEELNYLRKVKQIIQNGNKKADVLKLVEENIGKEIPTEHSLITRIANLKNKEFINNLTDIDDLRKKASYEDKNAPIYIENKNGIEFIHLQGYDYRFISTTITHSETQNSTFSRNLTDDFEQYRIFSEQLKENFNGKLTDMKIGKILKENPKAWNLIEGISTISTGVSSSKFVHVGYSWGKKSNLKILGISGGDGGVSHKLRDLHPNDGGAGTLKNARVLYGNVRGEIWFDRRYDNNQRVKPEAIIAQTINDYDMKAAQEFHCPIIVRHDEYYSKQYEQKQDLNARKQFLQTGEMKYIPFILYNNQNKDMDEKTNFLINSLVSLYQNGKIDLQIYMKKLTDLKWIFYENNYMEVLTKIDIIIQSYNFEQQEKERQHLR